MCRRPSMELNGSSSWFLMVTMVMILLSENVSAVSAAEVWEPSSESSVDYHKLQDLMNAAAEAWGSVDDNSLQDLIADDDYLHDLMAAAEEWGSDDDHNLHDPFVADADPFHKALNSLSAWMDDSNATQYMTTDIPIGEINNVSLRYYLPSPDANISHKCRKDVEVIIAAQNTDVKAALLKEEKLWPILIPDSWGKVPDGMFSGNLAPWGMMEECTSIHVEEHHIFQNTKFNGKYCFVVYGKYGPPLQEMGGYSFQTPNNIQKPYHDKDVPAASQLLAGHIPSALWGAGSSYGTCMPDSCSPEDFKLSLNEVLPNGNEAFWVHCHTADEEGPAWEAKDYAFVSVMGFIGFLVILAAAIDLTINYLGKQELRKGPLQYLLVFSGYTNMSKIFYINTKENPNNILCLHGMRVMSMTWVVWGHQYVMSSFRDRVNFLDMRYVLGDVLGQIILNAQVSVDSFFFLSGFLVGYGLMRSKDKMDLYNFFMFYIHRFLRLAPPIAAVCFFGATVARFFSTGAIGEANYLFTMEFCNRNWFYDVLFINNYSLRYCVGNTWYTSVDMQIYVLVPLLFFPLMYYRIIGTVWLMFMTLVSCIIPLIVTHIFELGPGMLVPMDKTWDNTFWFYSGPWCRMTPYIVGLWAGYVIYRSNKKPIKMESWQVILGWVTASIVAVLVVFGIYPFNHYKTDLRFELAQQPEQVVSDIYNGFFRGAWALALMWVVIACHTGYGGPVNSFLGHPSWQPLSRLTYGIFLVHIAVISLIVGTSYRPKALNHLQIIVETSGTLFISGIAAVVLSLLVDGPIIGLEKLLLSRPGGENKPAEIKESQNKI